MANVIEDENCSDDDSVRSEEVIFDGEKEVEEREEESDEDKEEVEDEDSDDNEEEQD